MNAPPPGPDSGRAATPAPDGAPPVRSSRRRLRPLVGFIIGVLLLAAAVWAVRSQGALAGAWATARAAPAWLVALAVLLPLVNWLIISLSFWVLMRRHGRIGIWEMAHLIGAAWLLNYLPLRPGMVGRVAYHKTVNGIPVSSSLSVMIIGMACAGAAVLTLLAAAAALGAGADPALWAGVLAVPAAAAGIAGALCAKLRRGPWWLAATYFLRYADVLVWALRYWVVFRLVGSPVDFAGAIAIAGVCQITLVVPVVGNGMGLREWAVGLTAGALPPGFVSAGNGTAHGLAGLASGAGLAADLANRAAELVIAVPVGLISASLLAARRRAGG